MRTKRRCATCHIEKSVDDFYVSNGKLNGWCKSCFRSWYIARSGGMVDKECPACGVIFSTTNRSRKKYCTRACKDSHKNQARSAALLRRKQELRRWCVWCGLQIPPRSRGDAEFCADECRADARREIRSLRRRGGRKILGDRDNWICGICGRPLKRSLVHPNPLAASIDHIMPLSLGGSNDLANLQLAHFVCNWTKGNNYEATRGDG